MLWNPLALLGGSLQWPASRGHLFSCSDEALKGSFLFAGDQADQGQGKKLECPVPLTSWVPMILKSQKPTFDRNLFALEIMQVTEKHFFPVTAITYEPQVGEGTFRGANFFFHFGKQVTYRGTKCRHCISS